ncbi:hypothetical protein IWQ47_001569 [Aquimarina sp. EL_43]|uniref:hypothetical protein n=1 Tax=unclassified Aquimarina TaxID=2627091 RepID=UPI0018C8F744|nr:MULTISPECIES: hypothetical protein [unclassified Aquimarina]MBG6130348.1 hypothetical protein [Aquimarina sp. EL_35]MBG6149128.1 hypothetical protein [Aquimarina sp. EL_32]MBG6168498.1 hypothetical protein [Aquimarina sp. EL_43]
MKNKVFFFGIYYLFLTLSGYAQDSSLKTQLQLLQNPSECKFLLDNTGFLAIKNAKFYTKNGDTDVFDINSKNIHIVDVNNDGAKDIIYQDNRHYHATVLLIKKGNDFVEIWNGSGALVSLKEGEKTTMYVLSSAIGCFDMTMLSVLVINSDNILTENTIALYSDTKMGVINKTFEQKIISGTLRTQPVTDDKKKTDPCTGDLKTGNQIRVIENKAVTVIKKQNEWFLVILKEKDQSIIGWVKI